MYVDDCLSGEQSAEGALKRAEELKRCRFLKRNHIFRKLFSSSISADGFCINVAGMKSFPKI